MNVSFISVQQNVSKPKSTSFRGVNLVQVSKKAFENPENLTACSQLFEMVLMYSTKEKVLGTFKSILALFSPKKLKTTSIMEKASYSMSMRGIQDSGQNLSIEWLRQNTGLPLENAIDPERWSFYVYTGAHKDDIVQAVRRSFKNTIEYIKEGFLKYDNDMELTSIFASAKTGVLIDEKVAEIVGDAPVKNFKIDKLEQLDDIVDNFDWS